MSEHLGICAVRGGLERKAQQDIERAGFGTRLPSFRVASTRHGRRQIALRPLFSGYVFTYLSPGYGALDEIEGVRLLRSEAHDPLVIEGRDEDKLARLELDCLVGDYNCVKHRNAAGQFIPTIKVEPSKKRRTRPRRGAKSAKAQRKKRRRERERIRHLAETTNQVAAC